MSSNEKANRLFTIPARALIINLSREVINLKLDPQKTGLGLGSLFGLMHLLWSLMVAIGFAQGLMDWIYSIHFLNNPFRVGVFDVMTALILIVITSIVGFVIGWVFATLWNYWQKK